MARDESIVTSLNQSAFEPQSKNEGMLLGPRLTAVVVEAMHDEYSRMILSSSVREGKTVDEICDENGIPQSTCYKRIRHLVDEGAMVVERIVVAPTGSKRAIYRSAFTRLEVRLENGLVSARATSNPAVADKLRDWFRLPDSLSYSHQKNTHLSFVEVSTQKP